MTPCRWLTLGWRRRRSRARSPVSPSNAHYGAYLSSGSGWVKSLIRHQNDVGSLKRRPMDSGAPGLRFGTWLSVPPWLPGSWWQRTRPSLGHVLHYRWWCRTMTASISNPLAKASQMVSSLRSLMPGSEWLP
jgi:hypothetical protein